MIRKRGYFLVLLALLTGLASGCSDDVSRITNPAETSQWDNALSTSDDEPGITFDVQEYLAGLDYYPGDTPPEDENVFYDEFGESHDDGIIDSGDEGILCR